MASTTNCPYCGGTVRSDEANCPHCGTGNDFYYPETEAASSQRPGTIAELQDYCTQRGLPLQRMRFFIGEDYRLPKAFGIYRDGANFVVYKNKSDGSRSVRYRGPDEARAVGELYDKLRSECLSRGIDPDNPRAGGSTSYEPTPIDVSQLSSESEYRGRQRSRRGGWGKIVGIVLALLLLSGMFRSCGGLSLGNLPFSFGSSSDSGYYSGDTWETEDSGGWFWGGSGDSSWSWDDDSDDSSWDWSDSDWDWDDSDTDWDSDW